jgi:hypothetical protein
MTNREIERKNGDNHKEEIKRHKGSYFLSWKMQLSNIPKVPQYKPISIDNWFDKLPPLSSKCHTCGKTIL